MRVFISWSKPTSHKVALILHKWLPEVIHHLEAWMSSEDISKGQRWGIEVGQRLDETSQGILCVTRENVREPWLNFEAGALAKSLSNAVVRPILFDLQPSEVTGPLAQFQATIAHDQQDMLKLVQSLNAGCEKPLDDGRLERSFSRNWREFSDDLQKIDHTPTQPEESRRDVTDMVSEILERTREIQRSLNPATNTPPRLEERERTVNSIHIREPLRRSFANMTLPELQALATSLGITGTVRMRKAQLIAAIQEKSHSLDRKRP